MSRAILTFLILVLPSAARAQVIQQAFTPTAVSGGTPTLSQARSSVGVSGNYAGKNTEYTFELDPSGWPNAVTSGELIVFPTTWPNASTVSWSDNESNSYSHVFSGSTCEDAQSIDHDFYYVVNAAAGTDRIVQSFGSTATRNSFVDIDRFYNIATSSPVDVSSCKLAVTPANNTAPNITGTAMTTTVNGDLIIVCVSDIQSSLGGGNTWTSITWPSGFTGLAEDPALGHACAYEVQATAGSFTPTFTVSQSTHDSFAIYAVSFKSGSGGSAPAAQTHFMLSQYNFIPVAGTPSTVTYALACPSGTTDIVMRDDSAEVTNISDSSSNTWTKLTAHVTPIFYVHSPTWTSSNTVTLTSSGGGQDLVAFDCLGGGTGGIDTGVTAGTLSGSTLYASSSGAVYVPGASITPTSCTNGPDCFNGVVDLVTSVTGDIVLDVVPDGTGPVNDCNQGASKVCVFEVPAGAPSGSAYTGAPWTSGDDQPYTNGNGFAHFYASTAEDVPFDFFSGTTTAVGGIAIAFKK